MLIDFKSQLLPAMGKMHTISVWLKDTACSEGAGLEGFLETLSMKRNPKEIPNAWGYGGKQRHTDSDGYGWSASDRYGNEGYTYYGNNT